MAGITQGQLFQYAEQQAMNAVFRTQQSPPAGAIYFALCSTLVGDLAAECVTMADPSIIEYPTNTGYTRQSSPMTPASPSSPAVAWNSQPMQWGPFSAPPGTAYWAIACTGMLGNAVNTIAAFLLSQPQTPLAGDTIVAQASTGNTGSGFICWV